MPQTNDSIAFSRATEVESRNWPLRRYPRPLTDDFIGSYELSKLVFAVEGSQLVLNPVGRFGPGIDGIFDLALLPDYESVLVLREADRWCIRQPDAQDEPREWSEDAFVEAAEKLARLA